MKFLSILSLLGIMLGLTLTPARADRDDWRWRGHKHACPHGRHWVPAHRGPHGRWIPASCPAIAFP